MIVSKYKKAPPAFAGTIGPMSLIIQKSYLTVEYFSQILLI
jgi:hypothetical protein